MRRSLRTLAGPVAACALLAFAGGGAASTVSVTGFDSATTERIDRAVSAAFVAQSSPGYAVAIWAPGRGEYLRAYGVANRRTGAPLQIEDGFRIGSVTKTMTAVTVLRLIDQGRLRLDTRVSSLVPGVANGSRITVRQLLGMRAGVWDYTSDPAFVARYWARPAGAWTPADTMRLIRGGSPQYAPGTATRYDNSNYVILGKVIERVTGRPALEVMRDEVIVPAGLGRTTLPTGVGMPGPFRRGYVPGPGGRVRDTTISNPAFAWTAGNGISTLHDLGTWARVLGTGQLLSPGLFAQQLASNRLPGQGPSTSRYGLGMEFYAGGWRGHSGYIFGYSTAMFMQPSTGTVIVTTGAMGAEDALRAVADVLG